MPQQTFPCPVCISVQGSCRTCWGSGLKETQHAPPVGLVKEACDVCGGTGECATCGGDGELTEDEYHSVIDHLPFDELPNQPNDLESWEDLLT